MADNPTCETCGWWSDPIAGGPPARGMCRRSPPIIMQGGAVNKYPWPVTKSTDYCGEHQPRQPAEAEAPRPRLDPETRRVLEGLVEAAAAAHDAYGNLPSDDNGDADYHELEAALNYARNHLAKMGGEGGE